MQYLCTMYMSIHNKNIRSIMLPLSLHLKHSTNSCQYDRGHLPDGVFFNGCSILYNWSRLIKSIYKYRKRASILGQNAAKCDDKRVGIPFIGSHWHWIQSCIQPKYGQILSRIYRLYSLFLAETLPNFMHFWHVTVCKQQHK